MFGPKGPFCQSCGMPLSKDKNGGGSEADGNKSTTYCSNCYERGMYTEPNITVEQMQEKVKKMMTQDLHFPGFIANYFTKGIPKLKRWASG